MGKASQRKGRAGELELCRIFQTQGIPAEPGKPVSFGETPDVVGIPGIHAEVKRVERLNVSEAMAQAVRDSARFQDGTPVLFPPAQPLPMAGYHAAGRLVEAVCGRYLTF